MASMRGWLLLLFFAVLPALATSSAHGNSTLTLRCHPDQAATLLKLKKSFFFDISSNDEDVLSTTKLESWQDGTDCCRWEGVGCGASSSRVTTLDLNGHGLYSRGLDPVIFNLTSLQFLDLSMNDFYGYSIPAVGFEGLTSLTHLNLSNSGFQGQIPMAIGKIENLISLDLSNHYGINDGDDDQIASDRRNSLSLYNFQTLVRNLSNLRELYLDYVEIYSIGEEWCRALAKFVPRLRVLSLGSCYLYGPIHESLSNLSSLTVINLQYNDDILAGPFPQFFMGFVNLSVLQLANTNLEGRFPHRNFKSKCLLFLDLSGNMNLSGSLPNFSNASSLETLRLDDTNFSYAQSGSFRNFKSLKELSIDGKFISMDFASSISMLGSLGQLQLSRVPFSENSGAILSLIGDLRNLTRLELVECDFSSMQPYRISNLSLKSLIIFNCNLTTSVLSAVANLVGLESLNIASSRIHGSMPPSMGNLTNLRILHISDCGFLGLMPSSIGNLVNLRNLHIYSTNFSGPVPSTIGYLRNLESLEIYESKFSGPMPSAIGNLSNLRSMDIYNCEISGPIPSTIGFLSNLKVLSISGCMFSGPIPYTVGQLKELKILWLRQNKYLGEIPNSVGNLTRLLTLDLSMNFLRGKIPGSVFTLPLLEHLHLSGNELSGPIEEFDVSSSCLVELELNMNELTGEVPRSFFKIRSLELLDIESNNFIGSVDLTSFWRLPKLLGLILSHNKLSVMDGAENNSSTTHPSRLRVLSLVSCHLTKLPSILKHASDVVYLDLSCNKISGDIPNCIWERWSSSLVYLNLSHNMFTSMRLNSHVLPLSTPLELLDLSSNRLQGHVPMPNSSARLLDYSHNSFSFIHPDFTLYLSHTEYLRMSHNSISGHVPYSVCNSNLGVLDLSYNNFSGLIPSCLMENPGLAVLNLRGNYFQGALPSNITDKCSLETIDLHGNNIEGQLPRALCNCNRLEVLDLGKNQIVDTFPSWLRRLSNLRVLVLRSNQFYGSINDLVGDHQSSDDFSSLQIVDLSSNNFTGNLSLKWFGKLKSMMAKFNSTVETLYAHNLSTNAALYQDSIEITYKGFSVTFERILTTLTAIDFSNNRLEGSIPKSVGQLISLRVLNMSHNAFTGKISAKFGSMAGLESLDLSFNQLSGKIPQELTNLTFLSILNLSENQLVGRIPQSHQFSTFENSSFQGNLGLCGLPLSARCGVSPAPPSAASVEKSSDVDVVLFLFVGLGFGLGFAGAILMRWDRISKRVFKYSGDSRT